MDVSVEKGKILEDFNEFRALGIADDAAALLTVAVAAEAVARRIELHLERLGGR
ncbi:MAG: hypothetical protein LAN62_09885 [Acidobacteriia bacterium]|nr:hypothetical protein [Terriglobia bacterium]